MKPKSKVWMYVLAGILVVGILFTSASFAAGVQSLPSSIEESIIVFAPHPDGGALGCAGEIYDAVQNGYDVKVVVMTNGDAYKHAFASWANSTDMDGDGGGMKKK